MSQLFTARHYNEIGSSSSSNTWVAGLAAFAVTSVVCYVALSAPAVQDSALYSLPTVNTAGLASRSLTTGAYPLQSSRTSTIMMGDSTPTYQAQAPLSSTPYSTMNVAPVAQTPKPLLAAAFGSLALAVGGLFALMKSKANRAPEFPRPLDNVTINLGADEFDFEPEEATTRWAPGMGFGYAPLQSGSVFGFDGDEEDYDPSELVVMYNRKKGLGCTKGGTNRKRAGVSGFRARKATVGGRKVLARRRAKGRKVLCAASMQASKHRAGGGKM